MKILLDTNVILDVLSKREPHYESSAEVLGLCGSRIHGFITVSQTTDIFYLLCRDGMSPLEAREILQTLTEKIKLVGVLPTDVMEALSSEMDDYEDALLAACGARQKVNYIITRNKKDFETSPVKALSPAEFLEKCFEII